MISENSAGGELSPIVFYYDEIDGMEYLCPRLEERFRQTGHTRPIIFKEYDCYKELPGTDGDLYTYDAVSFANFSYNKESRRPRFMADLISVGKNIQKEKMQDCLDLIRILISEQFVFELCVPDGQLQYLLPADRHVFLKLAEYDPLYGRLYKLLDSEENGVLRYGTSFYETFYSSRDILLQLLWEKAGWRPGQHKVTRLKHRKSSQ